MANRSGLRAFSAFGIAGFAALACFLFTGDPQISLVILVCAVVAVLIAGGMAELPTPPAAAAQPDKAAGPLLGRDVIEGIGEPVLIVKDNLVVAANSKARTLLGAHILGEDVRVAIRHPAAAEELTRKDGRRPKRPTHLVGLGTREQRWEMRVRRLRDGQRIVHLADRTGSYAAERMRVDFVANASHELRTPLASLLGFVETLRDEAGDDPEIRSRFLKIMHDEARRMRRLVDDLISLSRIEAEKYRAPSDSVDLSKLVAEVCEELAASGDPRAKDLNVTLETAAPVRGDRAQLSQLLHNIISNAMKYGREATPVCVALGAGDAMVKLVVSDQGEGIPSQHLPRLTERFYRVDSGRSRTLGGTGLGLAISKHVVERHRGRLDIASTPGIGTNVTIMLPVMKS